MFSSSGVLHIFANTTLRTKYADLLPKDTQSFGQWWVFMRKKIFHVVAHGWQGILFVALLAWGTMRFIPVLYGRVIQMDVHTFIDLPWQEQLLMTQQFSPLQIVGVLGILLLVFLVFIVVKIAIYTMVFALFDHQKNYRKYRAKRFLGQFRPLFVLIFYRGSMVLALSFFLFVPGVIGMVLRSPSPWLVYRYKLPVFEACKYSRRLVLEKKQRLVHIGTILGQYVLVGLLVALLVLIFSLVIIFLFTRGESGLLKSFVSLLLWVVYVLFLTALTTSFGVRTYKRIFGR